MSNGKPQIFTNFEFEADLRERLTAVGDLHALDDTSPERILEQLAPANAVIGWLTVDQAFLDAAPELRVVSVPAVGYDKIDVAAATARGVAVCNTPGVLNAAVVDLTTAIIIMLSRRLFEFENYSRSGAWGRREQPPALAHDIAGKVVGVIGFGRIGREVARRMQALDMRPIWYDVYDELLPGAPDVPFRPLDDLLRESDFVTVHMDLNETSRHLIGAREIGLMKETAYLVNTARGPVVDQKALTEALQSSSIAGAGLDVLEQEPPDAAEPIVKLPNVISFPHIGTSTHETRRAMRELSVANAIAVLNGEHPPAIVNPKVLEGES